MPVHRRRLLLALCVSTAAARGFAQVPRSRVEVGLCTSFRNIAAAKADGFDYAEIGTAEVAALPEAEFEQAVAEIRRIGLPVVAANLFLPGSLRVTGPDVDVEQQMAYVTRAFARLARLGVDTVVFGSGGARRVPEGFPRQQAFEQLVDFGRRIAPEARRHGIVVAVEPLRRQECNIINTAAEGLDLVRAVGHPNFQLMIDFYHLSSEQEDPAIVERAGAALRHLHMANPQGRVFPLAWEEFAYAPFFASLRSIGYTRRISLEASSADPRREAPTAISLLRRAFAP